jgi:hypothetical protein
MNRDDSETFVEIRKFLFSGCYSAKGYLGSNSHVSSSAKRMRRQTLSAWISAAIVLFKAQANSPAVSIVLIRADSSELFNLLNPNLNFDLIYRWITYLFTCS